MRKNGKGKRSKLVAEELAQDDAEKASTSQEAAAQEWTLPPPPPPPPLSPSPSLSSSQQIRQHHDDFMSWPADQRFQFMTQFEGIFTRSPVYQENRAAMMRHLMRIAGSMLK